MIQAYLFTELKESEETARLTALFSALRERFPHKLTFVDISMNPYLRHKYAGKLPLVESGGFSLHGRIGQAELGALLQQSQTQEDGKATKETKAADARFTAWDKLSLWFSRHFLLVLNLLIFIYVALPFAAPVLMKLEQPKAALPIYKAYSLTCHQLAYRSFFLFGEQAVYPLPEAKIEGLLTYSQATGLPAGDIAAAQAFLGNEELGYKVALCQRDVAIYAALLAFGLFFWAVKRKVKPITWFAWILFGLVPIGLDGGSQIIGQIFTSLPDYLLLRESTPFLRVLTGAMFGFMTAWFGYPSLDELEQFARERLEKKAAIIASAQESPR